MYCSKCGNRLQATAVFCSDCGYRVILPLTPPSPPRQQSANSNSGAYVVCYIFLGILGIAIISGIISVLSAGKAEPADVILLLYFLGIISAAIIGIMIGRRKRKNAHISTNAIVPAAQVNSLMRPVPPLANNTETRCSKCGKQIDDIEVVCPYCGQETPLYEEEVRKMKELDAGESKQSAPVISDAASDEQTSVAEGSVSEQLNKGEKDYAAEKVRKDAERETIRQEVIQELLAEASRRKKQKEEAWKRSWAASQAERKEDPKDPWSWR